MDLLELSDRKSGQSRHPWELARFEVVISLLRSYLRNEEGFKIADIGCGDIYFIKSMADLYPKATFYAVDTAFTDELIQKLTADIGSRKIFLFRTLQEAALHCKGGADLILLLDVMEHVPDDEDFLNSIRSSEIMTGKSRMMITVPAFSALFCSHDVFLKHFRRYSNRQVKAVVRKSGLETIKVGYFFTSLLPPRLIQVMKEKVVTPGKESTGLVEWNKGKALSTFFKTLLVMDYRITNFIKTCTGIRIPGLSNYAICKKPAS